MQKVVLSWHPSDLAFVLSLSSLKTLIWTSSNSVITGCFQASLKVFEFVSPLPPTCADASSARAPLSATTLLSCLHSEASRQSNPYAPPLHLLYALLSSQRAPFCLRRCSEPPGTYHPSNQQTRFCLRLSALGLPYWSTADWGAYEQQVFISHSSGGRKPEIGVPAWSGSARSPVWGCRRQLLVDGNLALWRPITGAPPTHLPKAPPPEQSQWGVDFDL